MGQAEDVGSIPITRSINAALVLMVFSMWRLRRQGVGSNPVCCSAGVVKLNEITL